MQAVQSSGRAILLALPLMILAAAEAGAVATTAKAWQRWEYPLTIATASLGTCKPYRDATLAVEYTNPSGQKYNGYGFWDGTNPADSTQTVFKIRASFNASGTWTWRTTFTGCGNPASLNQTDTVSVTASGVNTVPLYSQGGLRVNTASPNPSRFLVHASGVPFYWLGDTSWYGIRLASTADWTTYLLTRQGQGFTVIQTSMPTSASGQPTDFMGRTPFSGCTGVVPDTCSGWNPAFWQEFDRRINEANKKGFVVVLIGLFKRLVETQNWPSLNESKLYARNVVARLSGDHVLFSPGFDELPTRTQFCTDDISEAAPSCNNVTVGTVNCGTTPCPTNLVNMACRGRALGNHIRSSMVRSALDGKPLIGLETHHIGGGCKCFGTTSPCTSDYWLSVFQNEPWLDFQLFQSGQGANCELGNNLECLTKRARQRPKDLYNLPVTKPNVNGEGIYDQFGFKYDPGCVATANANYSDTRARQVGYLSTLSGAFGYSLGVAGTWDWGVFTCQLPSAGWSSASSTQMKHLCTLFRNLEWQKLKPDELKVVNQGTTEATKMVYSYDGTAGGGRFALAFLPIDSTKTFIDLNTSGLLGFTASWCKQWFNPQTGTYQNTNTSLVSSPSTYRFTKPNTSGDWVLLLKDTTFTCWTTPPKFCPCLTVSNGQPVCSTTP